MSQHTHGGSMTGLSGPVTQAGTSPGPVGLNIGQLGSALILPSVLEVLW